MTERIKQLIALINGYATSETFNDKDQEAQRDGNYLPVIELIAKDAGIKDRDLKGIMRVVKKAVR
jgi:hypothetical protein